MRSGRATSNMGKSQAAGWSAANARTHRCIEGGHSGAASEPSGEPERRIGGGLRDEHSRACVWTQETELAAATQTARRQSPRFTPELPRRNPPEQRRARRGVPPGSGVREYLLRAKRRPNRRVSGEASQRRGRTRRGGARAANPEHPPPLPSKSTAGVHTQPESSRLRYSTTPAAHSPPPSSSSSSSDDSAS